MPQMMFLRRHADLMMFARAIYGLPIPTTHRAADHGHGPSYLRHFGVDAHCGSCGGFGVEFLVFLSLFLGLVGEGRERGREGMRY